MSSFLMKVLTAYYCREPEFHFEAAFQHKDHLRVSEYTVLSCLVLSCLAGNHSCVCYLRMSALVMSVISNHRV